MIRTTAFTAVFGTLLLMAGCNNASMGEFRWDWWNKSSEKPEDSEDVSGKFVAPDDVPDDANAKVNADTSNKTSSKPDTTAGTDVKVIKKMDPSSLELRRHKQDVWSKVVMLRDKDKLPEDKQAVLIENARREMKEWYSPLKVSPPNPDSADWIDIMIWDFMPEEEFQEQSAKWKSIADKLSLQVPVPLTRRGMVPLITDIMKLMDK